MVTIVITGIKIITDFDDYVGPIRPLVFESVPTLIFDPSTIKYPGITTEISNDITDRTT